MKPVYTAADTAGLDFLDTLPGIAPYVRGAYQGWVESAASFPSRLEVPFPGVVLILDLGTGFRLADPRTGEQADLHSFMAGLADGYVYVAARGPSRCIQVNLTPLGAYRLLRLPMGSLANRSIHLEDLLGSEARRWEERLAEAPDWEARFDLLDDLLVRRIEGARAPASQVAWAWERLAAAGGQLEVGGLARELGWSRKHLAARFHEAIGLAPKTVARIFRFHRTVESLEKVHPVRWADLACDCGYYDQAHLIREFQEFAGASPAEYLRRRLPDGGGVEGGVVG